jgi:hypothetical protein
MLHAYLVYVYLFYHSTLFTLITEFAHFVSVVLTKHAINLSFLVEFVRVHRKTGVVEIGSVAAVTFVACYD